MERALDYTCAGCSGAAGAQATDGIGRRTFIAQSALLAVAAMLAACGADAVMAPSTIATTTIKASDYPALATVGGIALVSLSGNPFAVVRTADSSFVTLSRICPHQGNIVNINGNGFLCPGHGAQFSATGTWFGGQPTSNLRSYSTAYDATTGTITIG